MGTPIPKMWICSYSVVMPVMRFVAPVLLVVQIPLHFWLSGVWSDLIAFNSVAIASVMSVLTAPRINNRWAQPLTACAIGVWSIGSIIVTSSSYLNFPNSFLAISDSMYLLFYPLAILGLHLLISAQQRLTVLEVVDASIVGLGLSTLGAAFALQPVLPYFDGDLNQSFLATIYPVADLVLLCFIIATFVMQGFSQRGLLLSLGVVIYAITDLIFLWHNLNMSYTFGSLIDYGWLLSFVVIAESTWRSGTDNRSKNGISPVLITISVFLSATLLALLAIAPDNLVFTSVVTTQ